MTRAMGTLAVLALTAGCQGIRTQAFITVQKPLDANVKAEVTPNNDPGPLKEVFPDLPVGEACQGPKVAVVEVDGLLLNAATAAVPGPGDNPVGSFQERLSMAARDPSVCAVVVRINSPGGGVTAADIMANEIHEYKRAAGKPVVACVMDVGAGGGYYVAAACDYIVAHPTSLVGGVGVIFNAWDLLDTIQQYNAYPRFIKAGAMIDIGSPVRELPEEERTILQNLADRYHVRFKEAVRSRRDLRDEDKVFDGRVFSGDEAKALGLVDEVGYLRTALAKAGELSGQKEARVVVYRRRHETSRSVMGVGATASSGLDLLHMSGPGLDRSKLPSFLYLWQPEPTLYP